MEKLFGTKSGGGCQNLRDELNNERKRLRETLQARNENSEGDGPNECNTMRDILEQDANGISSRIAKLQEIVAACEEIEITERNIDFVSIGSIVEYKDSSGSEDAEHIIEIAGYGESDGKGRVSYTAPIAKAMIGKGAGDIASVIINHKEKTLQICKLYSEWPIL